MANEHSERGGPRILRPLNGIGTRAAASALRPFSAVGGAAMGVGVSLERHAVDRVLESREIERIVIAALDSPHVQAAFRRALESPGAKQLVDTLFDSGLFDRILERLGSSDGLWRLIDEIAQSPAVTAAISQQGLGFADQVGDAVRNRSRRADDWLERAAHRLTRRADKPAPPEPGVAP